MTPQEEINREHIKVCRKIAHQGFRCHGIKCDDCPFVDEICDTKTQLRELVRRYEAACRGALGERYDRLLDYCCSKLGCEACVMEKECDELGRITAENYLSIGWRGAKSYILDTIMEGE